MKYAQTIERLLGSYGEAYDTPETLRAYSYRHQPGNSKAWKLGEALRKAQAMSTGDYIDTGLNILKALGDINFGVFELDASEPRPSAPEEVAGREAQSSILDKKMIARIVIGPRNAVPAGSRHTLEELQEIRWNNATNGERVEAQWIADAILKLSTQPAASVSPEVVDQIDPDERYDDGRDAGADFVLGGLATLLGLDKWEQKDGSEEWEGDVSATLYGILKDARVIDPWDNTIATHATLHEERKALSLDGEQK